MADEITAAETTHQRRKKILRDIFNIVAFVIAVVLGAYLLNSFIFQSFNVEGPSMEPTMHTDDRLIVNKIVVSYAQIRNTNYIPPRGQIIVFSNPLLQEGSDMPERHLVKRVIGLPGERVVVRDGKITVYNGTNPRGFNPDGDLDGPKHPSSGDIELELAADEVFVAGDNRIGSSSFDSRNGLGPIPLKNIEGPVFTRLWPLSQFRIF